MISLVSLWGPILLSAVIVFVASSVIHMAPLWHKGDYPKMPREAEALDALRPLSIPPGDYFIPRASGMNEMRTSEFKDKLNKGPVAVMTVMPNGQIQMGRSMVQWFVFLIVVGISRPISPGERCRWARRICGCSRSSAQPRSPATHSRCASCRSGTAAPGASR